jgi:hypothetical protein
MNLKEYIKQLTREILDEESATGAIGVGAGPIMTPNWVAPKGQKKNAATKYAEKEGWKVTKGETTMPSDSKMYDYKSNAKIICTQPRVQPTVDNATRISNELGLSIEQVDNFSNEPIKTNNYYVQYKHQLDYHTKLTKHLSLEIVTDGILLEILKKNPTLKNNYKMKVKNKKYKDILLNIFNNNKLLDKDYERIYKKLNNNLYKNIREKIILDKDYYEKYIDINKNKYTNEMLR